MDFSIQFDTHLSGICTAVAGFGVFDGVHPGHSLIIRTAAEMASSAGALPAALTFVPHPRAVIPGSTPPGLLISVPQRLRLLRQAGAEVTGIINFTPEFGAMEPEEFLEALLRIPGFKLRGLCVGEDWRFGRGGKGDAELLDRFAQKNGLLFRAVKRLERQGINISSSVIRERAGAGDLAGAAEILGRDLTLSGIVEKGFRVAGSQLNAPTANLHLAHDLLVPDGVYAGAAEFENTIYPAVLNIGFAPTYNVNERRVEVHLLDFSGELYGRELEVSLFARLRPEKKFPSPAELKEQIVKDIANTAAIFKDRFTSGGYKK